MRNSNNAQIGGKDEKRNYGQKVYRVVNYAN